MLSLVASTQVSGVKFCMSITFSHHKEPMRTTVMPGLDCGLQPGVNMTVQTYLCTSSLLTDTLQKNKIHLR